MLRTSLAASCPALFLVLASLSASRIARADGDIGKVQHVVVVMQENHSFDNYFGALAYAPGSPYHTPQAPGAGTAADGGCAADDHACVDGLRCVAQDSSGNLLCRNANQDDDGSTVVAFHGASTCQKSDLDHSWVGVHKEANYSDPNGALSNAPADGFVRVNDSSNAPDNGAESATDDQTISFYDQQDIPFYYDLAQKFAIDDRYFCSVLGPTFPNRSYLMAATSFGHVTTSDTVPVPGFGGYKPVTGTIFDLLDAHRVSWVNYFSDLPNGASFRLFRGATSGGDVHFLPVALFLAQAAGLGSLPQVSFVDSNYGILDPSAENDEHPPSDIRRGQAFVSQILNAVRNGPNWQNTVVFITYDEHGGFYDHVAPPPAAQGGARTPDGIAPGQCADLSLPPLSLMPGAGQECSWNFASTTDTTLRDAIALCPALATNPTGPFPAECASFDQLGFRVPFTAVSPFSKPHYVSHTVGDHTSILAFIEKRFLSAGGEPRAHLTARDGNASTLEDLFDFDRAPSLGTRLTQAAAPAQACVP